MTLCTDKEREEVYTLLFNYFGLDWKTPINKRIDYMHSVFFYEPRFAEFMLSVYAQIIEKRFLTIKQRDTLRNHMMKNPKHFQSYNGKNISIDHMLERFFKGDINDNG